jgi:hypothetical protein
MSEQSLPVEEDPMKGICSNSRRRLSWIVAGVAFAVLTTPASRGWTVGQSDAGGPKEGCPFKLLNQKVQATFGSSDRAMYNGGEIQGGEIPGVIKVEQVTIYSCAFQRRSSGEVLQLTAFLYPSAEEAVSGFDRAGKARNADGPYYKSGLKQGDVQMLQGPGRLAAYLDSWVVIVHWLVQKGPRLAPNDIPGSRLAPIALVWLHPK